MCLDRRIGPDTAEVGGPIGRPEDGAEPRCRQEERAQLIRRQHALERLVEDPKDRFVDDVGQHECCDRVPTMHLKLLSVFRGHCGVRPLVTGRTSCRVDCLVQVSKGCSEEPAATSFVHSIANSCCDGTVGISAKKARFGKRHLMPLGRQQVGDPNEEPLNQWSGRPESADGVHLLASCTQGRVRGTCAGCRNSESIDRAAELPGPSFTRSIRFRGGLTPFPSRKRESIHFQVNGFRLPASPLSTNTASKIASASRCTPRCGHLSSGKSCWWGRLAEGAR